MPLEPFTITVGVVSLVTRVVQTANDLYNLGVRWANVPQTLEELLHEIQVVQGSLLVVEGFLRNASVADLPAHFQDVFPIAIRGCEATLLCLEQEFAVLTEHVNWWEKLKTVWKDDSMQRLLVNLSRRQISLVLLIQCLQL